MTNPDPQNSAPAPSISEAPASSPELDRLAVEADQVRPDMAGAPAPDAGGGGAPAAPEKPDTVRMLRGVIAPLFMYLAPAWKITADEVDLLSQAYAAVLKVVLGKIRCLACDWDGALVRNSKQDKPYMTCSECGCVLYTRPNKGAAILLARIQKPTPAPANDERPPAQPGPAKQRPAALDF